MNDGRSDHQPGNASVCIALWEEYQAIVIYGTRLKLNERFADASSLRSGYKSRLY